MSKIMICPSCGAEVDPKASECPFCGTTFEEGQEIKYMDRLDDLLEDVDDIDNDSRAEYAEEIRSYGRLAAKIFIRVFAAAAVLGIIIWIGDMII